MISRNLELHEAYGKALKWSTMHQVTYHSEQMASGGDVCKVPRRRTQWLMTRRLFNDRRQQLMGEGIHCSKMQDKLLENDLPFFSPSRDILAIVLIYLSSSKPWIPSSFINIRKH